MKAGEGQPDKMAEAAELTSALSNRILEQHEAGILIRPEQFRMFVRAAQLLLDNAMPLPASAEQLIAAVAERLEAAETAQNDESEPKLNRLHRLRLMINEAIRQISIDK